MVAKIESGKSLKGALNYNENKVGQGRAELIAASGYARDHDGLSFYDKLFRLTDLAARNLRTRTNTLHLSLNFDISETIATEKMVAIADNYMKRIGFENQPYLIYKHFDAGHPHIHIVSTNIEANGKRISLHKIGELKSEPARKAIELAFDLVQASSKEIKAEQVDNLKPLEYGITDTKRAITNVVNSVAKSYKFTSLPEFNAILGLFNVTADKGSKESVMYKTGGLRYWAIDRNGQKMGVPIKASSIYLKPTLKLLEDRFKLNDALRKPFKEQLKSKIGKVLPRALSLVQFREALGKAGVSVIIRQNADGRVYGLSFIDHLNKTIFNGSDLGKSYSAAAVLNSFRYKSADTRAPLFEPFNAKYERSGISGGQFFEKAHGHSLLDDLLNPYDPGAHLPDPFGPRKKKKKRRNLNL